MTDSMLDTATTRTAIWRCVAAKLKSESSWIYCSLTTVVIKESEDDVLELPTRMGCVIKSFSLPNCLSRKKREKSLPERSHIMFA
jgi:hypothetical protein